MSKFEMDSKSNKYLALVATSRFVDIPDARRATL